MLLILDLVYQDKVAAQVARDLYRSKSWVCEWLKRYDKEGIEGLKTRQKSGIPPELSDEVIYKIKKELIESSYHGWSTKQIEELIVKKSGIKYHYIHIYRIFENEFKQKIPRKVHVNTASQDKKREVQKKRLSKYLLTDNNGSSKNKMKRKKALP